MLKVSQQHIRMGSRDLQPPHSHRVAPPQEAREWQAAEGRAETWEQDFLVRGQGQGALQGHKRGLSLDHEGMGSALVGAVRLALGWQQLLGVHQGYACDQPQWLQAAQLGTGSRTMRHEEDEGGPRSPNTCHLPGQTPKPGFEGIS